MLHETHCFALRIISPMSAQKSPQQSRRLSDGEMGLVVDERGKLHPSHDVELAQPRQHSSGLLRPREAGIARKWPVITFGMFIAIWAVFIVANLTIEKDDHNADENWQQRISPANRQWWFYTYYPWPECSDRRYEAWRLFSMQFAHNGLQHILGNTLCGLVYGCALEVYYPAGHALVFIIFQVSVCLGTLGFALLWPYSGLIGASPGVYGLFGAALSLCLFDRAVLDPGVLFVLPLVLLSQLVADVVIYFTEYSATVGYASHFFGGLVGFLLFTSVLCWRHPGRKLFRTLSIVAQVGFLLLAAFLIAHYFAIDPPQPLQSSYFHNTGDAQQDCCAQLFSFLEDNDGLSQEGVMKSAVCYNNQFRYYGPSSSSSFSSSSPTSLINQEQFVIDSSKMSYNEIRNVFI